MWKECIGVLVSENEGVVNGMKYVMILTSENYKLLSVSLLDLPLHSTPFRKQSVSWYMESSFK